MTSVQEKTALVIGGSSGVGRATVKALVGGGARVVAVARGAKALDALRDDLPGIQTLCGDAADGPTMRRWLEDVRPDLTVLAAGVLPPVASIEDHTWASFSAAWSCDTQAAFHLVQGALTMPLRPGSVVVIVSSGAAIGGSPLSGGYAGAKRMQWLLAGYAQQVADRRSLGIRFMAVLPNQLIENTSIASVAAAAYGASQGISGAAFMQRFEAPLDVDKVAAAIVAALSGDLGQALAVKVSGRAIEPL